MSSPLRRLAAWLCLATALLAGLTPAQGFVLCLEPDGRVSVDLVAATEHCTCCEVALDSSQAHVRGADPHGPACCECVDLVLSAPAQGRLDPPQSPVAYGWPCPAPRTSAESDACVDRVRGTHARTAEAPRPPGTLGCIRSVVLLL